VERKRALFSDPALKISSFLGKLQNDAFIVPTDAHRIDEQGGVLYRYDFVGLALPIGLISLISFSDFDNGIRIKSHV
jgi:hypothetical protein